MNGFLSLILFISSAQASTCVELLNSKPNNVTQLFPTNANSSELELNTLALRLETLRSNWFEEWNQDLKVVTESSRLQSLNILKELSTNRHLQSIFTEYDLEIFHTITTAIVRSVTDKLYLPGGDVSDLRSDQWAELIVFFELKRVESPLDVIILKQLESGLAKFYLGRGSENLATYQHLLSQIQEARRDLRGL